MWLWIGLLACRQDEDKQSINIDTAQEQEERASDFMVSVGVESVTVLDAVPNVPLTLYNSEDVALVTLISDHLGQAHFAYIPSEHMVLDPSNFEGVSLENGRVLEAEDGYYIQDDTTEPPNWSGRFSVRSIDDVAPEELYSSQELVGVPYSILTGDDVDQEEGYQYIEVRDGVLLGAMVRFPEPALYGEGPYPTVIEYSGYAPSRPDRVDAGTLIANSLGYATVSVNMRGTGCSGGVFDVFNRAQHADGYDIIETVARQDWVLNNQVGMVGLSYPGISQLYVGSTNPPSLAAIVPLSTISDAWEMQWPGGIYNKGFTRQWVEERESQSQAGGSSWVDARIAAGDSICEENLKLSAHSVDFESFLRALQMRPVDADARDLRLLAQQIESPIFFGGAFQDEQTGAQFGEMIDRFDRSSSVKIYISNGRHPDGFAPDKVYRWFEFLEFYVAERIPELNPLVRAFASEFGGRFELANPSFEEDRFVEYESYEAALAAYETEPSVQLMFEAGATSDPIGAPGARFSIATDTWPMDNTLQRQWFLAAGGQLSEELPSDSGSDAWTFDSEADGVTFFGPQGYQLMTPIWDIDWTRFAEGNVANYVTPAFTESTVVAGPAIADVWFKSPVDDVMVQVTLTEVRPDNTEYLIQTGWLRLGHRASTEGEDLRLIRTYSEEDFQPVPINEWIQAKISIPSFAHPIREGSSLAMYVSSPGRDHGTWEFETPEYDTPPAVEIGFGADKGSALLVSILPDISIPSAYPPCPSLRGQPCRDYVPTINTVVD